MNWKNSYECEECGSRFKSNHIMTNCKRCGKSFDAPISEIEPEGGFGRSGLGIGRIADVDPTTEILAELEAEKIMQERNKNNRREPKLCDCGHWSTQSMSASLGSACPDCYDRMSDC